jgi:hypothetical protein
VTNKSKQGEGQDAKGEEAGGTGARARRSNEKQALNNSS